ncbi:hypothetical protein Holit_03286 [Hollandina sp. SP2]
MKKTRIKQEFIYTGVNLTQDIRHEVYIAAAENDATIGKMMRHLIILGLEAYKETLPGQVFTHVFA